MKEKIIFEPLYEIGDEFYKLTPRYDITTSKCDACDGKGFIKIKGNDFKCVTCDGTGKIFNQGKGIYDIDTIEVFEIHITKQIGLNKNKESLAYGLRQYVIHNRKKEVAEEYYFTQNMILDKIKCKCFFTTLEDAQNEINKLMEQ